MPPRPPGSGATLADLRGVTPWLWVICERCQHRAPTALVPWIISTIGKPLIEFVNHPLWVDRFGIDLILLPSNVVRFLSAFVLR
jgi:hypothetical protein